MVALHATAPKLHHVLFEETPLPETLRAELAAAEDALVEIVASSLPELASKLATAVLLRG